MRRRVGSLFIAVATVFGAVALSSNPVGASPSPTTEPATTIAAESTVATTTTTTTVAPETTTTTRPATPQGVAEIVSPDPASPDGEGAARGQSQGPIAGGDVAPGRRGPANQVIPIPPPPITIPLAERLPENSGNGRRIVYYKTGQRVWLVDDNNNVIKTYLVSGRLTWNQPSPGQYSVFSRSRWTCAVNNPSVCWPYMIRFTYGPGGLAIGFHEIPTNRATGRKLQSISELGQARSAGCIRQAPWDAAYLWDWAPVGTKVVVIQ